MKSERYDQAFERLKVAIDKDRALLASGDVDTVITEYKHALRLFQDILEVEDPEQKALVTKKLSEYRQRLRVLIERKGSAAFEAAISMEEKQSASNDQIAEKYLESVECYLESLKVEESSKLRMRVENILDRVNLIKTKHLMTALPVPPSANNKIPTGATSSVNSPRQRPSSSLTEEEMSCLRSTSVVNGRTFLPWVEGHDEINENFRFDTGQLFTDPEGLLPLSSKQAAKLGGWKRPSEFVRRGMRPQMIKNISPFSIEQDIVADCSFVASLCITAAYERRFKKPLITRIIYPQDSHGTPIYNPYGKYMVKLWANGAPRRVIVDDYLPVDKAGNLLCSRCADVSELWVSIIEKAYMKLNGGYEFQGSNSGIDLFALTGWIPEQIFFRDGREADSGAEKKSILDHTQTTERAWDRLKTAFNYGDCLVTVATSSMTEEEASLWGLVSTHAYAVLDVKEVLGGQRFLLCKNPWARQSWRGPYSASDEQRWTPQLRLALNYDPTVARSQDDGIFWIDWESLLRFFSTIFLNWSPALFSHKTVTHACWPASIGPKNDLFNYGYNPQYVLQVKQPAPSKSVTVWVLLSRHVKDGQLQGDFLTLHVYRRPKVSTLAKLVRYHNRVIYPTAEEDVEAYVRGVYTNNPHNLIRLDIDTATDFILVLSQVGKERDVYYSLTVLSTGAFEFASLTLLPDVVASLEGQWNETTAGGRLGSSSFYLNPQYSLVLTRPSAFFISLMAPKDFYVSFSVIGGLRGGKRVDSILQGEEIMTSGSYRQGFCYALTAETLLQPGSYTIVVSAYEASMKGNFIMKICSADHVPKCEVLLPEGDGMIRQILEDRWSLQDGSAAGSSSSKYLSNPTYLLRCPERVRLMLRLICDVAEPINATLYRTSDDVDRLHPSSELVVTTSHQGIYTSCKSGISTKMIDIDAGAYYIIVSMYNENVESSYQLIVYNSSSTKLQISKISLK